MRRWLLPSLALLSFAVPVAAHTDGLSKIDVMTQNQYIGADLTPLVVA